MTIVIALLFGIAMGSLGTALAMCIVFDRQRDVDGFAQERMDDDGAPIRFPYPHKDRAP